MKELEEIYQEMLDCFAQRTGLEAAETGIFGCRERA